MSALGLLLGRDAFSGVALRRRISIWWSLYVERRLQNYGPIFSERLDHRAVRAIGWCLHGTRRRLQGARGVEQGPTDGSLAEPGLEIEWSGMCPVQGDGIVDGRACYYRSRGDGWQFRVAPVGSDDALDADAWEHSEDPYIWPAGGYVAARVSAACIQRAVARWREAGRP